MSYETDQPLCQLAHHVITGEGETTFRELCQSILKGLPPSQHIITGVSPDLATLEFPYDLYTDDDIAHRILYVEASRGCPFKCEFCLSSLDQEVRSFDQDRFLNAMSNLWDRGVRHFKFVDRTFNLKISTSKVILEFFLERTEPGMFIHFEMIPDRLPEKLRDVIRKFPAGALQFEVGIQTFDPKTAARISRKQDLVKLEDNLKFLAQETGVHVHTDLIMGLPGENLESIAAGFDRLIKMGPQEIQVGILKRLRGSPIIRHTQEHGMVYAPQPPYEILQTNQLDFETVQQLKRFAHAWDAVANSGNFTLTLAKLLEGPSPFNSFMAFTLWLQEMAGRTHSLALDRLAGFLLQYLTQQRHLDATLAQDTLAADYARLGRRTRPKIAKAKAQESFKKTSIPARQARHLGAASPV